MGFFRALTDERLGLFNARSRRQLLRKSLFLVRCESRKALMKSPAFSPSSIRLAKILALAAADYVAGSLSVQLANPPGSAPTVWPPAGIALAGVLLFGSGIWPGI